MQAIGLIGYNEPTYLYCMLLGMLHVKQSDLLAACCTVGQLSASHYWKDDKDDQL